MKSIEKVAIFSSGCIMALLLIMSFIAVPNQASNAYATCKCVVFRLDDVQDYFLTEAQMKVMNLFEKENASITIGIIGNFFGNDTRIVSFVKNETKQPQFQFANHGWNHEDFSLLSEAKQSALLGKTNKKLHDLLGVTPKIFLAPLDGINNDTLLAAEENGIKFVSANMTRDPPPYNIGDAEAKVYRMPTTAATGDLSRDGKRWIGFNHTKVFGDIQQSLAKYGFAVVTMHPQEYSIRNNFDYKNKIDSPELAELDLLLHDIHAKDIQIVKMPEVVSIIHKNNVVKLPWPL